MGTASAMAVFDLITVAARTYETDILQLDAEAELIAKLMDRVNTVIEDEAE